MDSAEHFSSQALWICTVTAAIAFALHHIVAKSRVEKQQREMAGPVLQFMNKVLHTEPFSFLFYGIFWSFVLIILCPLAGCALVIRSLWIGIIDHFSPKAKIVNALDSDKELAVYITGCDHGFGKELSLALSMRGFVVFAGCLTESGIEEFKDHEYIIPLKVDVCKPDDSTDAALFISKWIEEPSKSSRALHCIVNNAGIGHVGLIDWNELSSFRKVMDVNCFGTIRTVKSFLPLLKKQVYENTYTNARIVNVTSLASFISLTGNSAYSSSKHAAEAFTSCLRLEMQAFDLPVVSVSPSWHKTPLSNNVNAMLESVWSRLSKGTQEEYGEGYFSSFSKAYIDRQKSSWSTDIMIKELISTVELLDPPPQVMVGGDAKYSAMILRMLPVWLQLKVFDYLLESEKAVKLQDRKSVV